MIGNSLLRYMQILDNFLNVGGVGDTCPNLQSIVGVVKFAIKLICWAVPIILIVLVTIDVAKVATAGNLDDKMKKEVGNKVVTRLIYALIIFLVPTIIGILFNLLGDNFTVGTSNGIPCKWSDVWNGTISGTQPATRPNESSLSVQ